MTNRSRESWKEPETTSKKSGVASIGSSQTTKRKRRHLPRRCKKSVNCFNYSAVHSTDPRNIKLERSKTSFSTLTETQRSGRLREQTGPLLSQISRQESSATRQLSQRSARSTESTAKKTRSSQHRPLQLPTVTSDCEDAATIPQPERPTDRQVTAITIQRPTSPIFIASEQDYHDHRWRAGQKKDQLEVNNYTNSLFLTQKIGITCSTNIAISIIASETDLDSILTLMLTNNKQYFANQQSPDPAMSTIIKQSH